MINFLTAFNGGLSMLGGC